MSEYKAVIFDMDGLLIDSMIHWIDLDKDFFTEHGLELTEEVIKYLTGRSERENIAWLKKQYNLSEDIGELMKQRFALASDIYQVKTSEMPGVRELLAKVKERGLKRALASGCPLRHIETAARRFNWDDYLEHYVSADHVNYVGKPDPAIYLYAAEKLQIRPEQCVVLEDAENGIVAAKRAGMTCIAVPDSRWSFGDFSQADLIATALTDRKIFDYLKL